MALRYAKLESSRTLLNPLTIKSNRSTRYNLIFKKMDFFQNFSQVTSCLCYAADNGCGGTAKQSKVSNIPKDLAKVYYALVTPAKNTLTSGGASSPLTFGYSFG